ncbi:MAG TPA: hypothetical protein VHM90_22275 [Phycisphaerae bacterium]|nr:hypothetical protein [Phycisphaerae bacterium]
MLKKWATGVGLGVAALAATSWAQQGGGVTAPAGLRFTVGKETTAIVSPLKADGSPDYLLALNEKYGKGVTAENNGYALLQQVMGTSNTQLSEQVREPFLRLLGNEAVPGGAGVWENFEAYRQRTHAADDAAAGDRFTGLHRRLWKAEEMPEAASYLKAEEALLARGAEAAERPRWWIPSVSRDGSVIGAVLPSLGSIRNMANTLGARATLRAQAGDFDGFLADVHTLKLLGARMTHGTTLIEALVGVAIGQIGDETIGAVAASGKLTEGQCARIAKMLEELPPQGSMADIVDCSERWTQLDMTQLVSRAPNAASLKAELKANLIHAGLDADGTMLPVFTIDVEKVDWDVPLKRINERFDKIIATTVLTSTKECLQANDALDAELEKWKEEARAGDRDRALSWKEGEAKDAYSQRVSRGLMAEFLVSVGKAEVLRRRGVMVQHMAELLLVAAQARARDGKWPETAVSLVPTRLKAVPQDIFAEGIGDGAVRYRVTPAGPQVYSIGFNGKDDGGARDFDKGLNDVGIGAETKMP